MADDLGAALARTVLDARSQQGLSVASLSLSSGVSRTMISKVERGEVQPTAALLARLSGALGLTLSELIARAETADVALVRADDQITWTDPDSGYTRRVVSPPSRWPVEMIEISLPPGAEVAYPAAAYRFFDQQVWVLDGELRIVEASTTHDLGIGDCLRFGAPQDRVFANTTVAPNRYLVVLAKRSAHFASPRET